MQMTSKQLYQIIEKADDSNQKEITTRISGEININNKEFH